MLASPTSSRPTSLTAAGAIAAAIATLALTACGPHAGSDANALASGAPTTTAAEAQTTPPAPNPAETVAPPVVQSPPAPQAVPPVATAPAPSYAVPPRTAQPAQGGYAQTAPAYQPPAPGYAPAPDRRVAEARPVDRNNIGSVQSIEPIRNRPQGSGAGAVIGGVLGAVVGNQFGHSTGRAAMTGLGAVGGAVAGNNIERNHREGITGYRVSVRLDNGRTRTYERHDVGNLQVGDRVRLDANSFHRV